MKKMIFLVALAMAGTALAQPQKDAPKPNAPKPEAAKPAPVKAAASKPATVARKSKRNQDARHCLQRSDNTAIIKCAEEFL